MEAKMGGRIYPQETKNRATKLRKSGLSLKEISDKMEIPKNTILGWVKGIKLTEEQKAHLKKKELEGGAKGRPLAIVANRRKIEKWKENIRKRVKYFEKFSLKDPQIGKLICGLMYLCEGAKYPSTRYLQFGNSDSQIINFFIASLRKYFHIDENKFRVSISYRFDQKLEKLINFWSHLTKIPKTHFLNSKPDIRTKGKRTIKEDYKGVCKIIYYDTSLQFELQSIGETIIKSGAGGD